MDHNLRKALLPKLNEITGHKKAYKFYKHVTHDENAP